MAAVIATLLEEEWNPATPVDWEDPEGTRWQLNLSIPNLPLQLRHQVALHAARRQWKASGQHYLASGIEQGIDLRSFRQELRTLGKGLAPTVSPTMPTPSPGALIGMAHRILQGAIWPNTRKVAAGYQPPGNGSNHLEANKCRFCGALGQGHHFHETWECEEVHAVMHPQLRASDDLLQAARQHYARHPCFLESSPPPVELD